MKAHASRVDALFLAYDADPSRDLRNQLIRLHIGLVRKVIYQTCQQLPGANDGLEAIAIQGLFKAIDAYSVSQRQSFCHFAIPYIRRELKTQACSSQGLTAANPVAARAS
ncbi:hypothetical protein C7271_13100 [filamentous cyanobacterium CCP5]|nr:hypothetical protein C7271_13100 [filamentous cyanobacterium CCP5]